MRSIFSKPDARPDHTGCGKPASVRTITSGRQLFRWLVERLDEQGPRIRIDRRIAAHYRTFVRELSHERRILLPPITSHRVSLLLDREEREDEGVEIGKDLLFELGSLGDFSEHLGPKRAHAIESCVESTLWAWEDNERFIAMQSEQTVFRYVSTSETRRVYGVEIDVAFAY